MERILCYTHKVVLEHLQEEKMQSLHYTKWEKRYNPILRGRGDAAGKDRVGICGK